MSKKFMTDVDNNATDDKSDVDNNANHDKLDDILDGDKNNDDKDKSDDKKDDKDSSDKKDDQNKKDDAKNDTSKPFNKKIGSKEYTSEEEYDAAVNEMNTRNSNMAANLGKHGIDPKTGEKKEVNDDDKKDDKDDDKKKETEKADTPEESYYKIEAVRFSKKFPDSNGYKDEMRVFIKNGRANINGEPSYAVAYAKALRADGKPIPDNIIRIIAMEKGEDVDSNSKSYSKKVIRSGGGSGNQAPSDQDTYQSQEQLDDVSDFGNRSALGKI